MVGYALYFSNYSTFRCAPVLYLEDLFVVPERRGQGHGKALLAAVARVAVERGCPRLEWTVLDWNPNAEADLASYTVLRGTSSGGPYDIVARGLTRTAFTDRSANQPRTYYYVLEAVDRSLNRSQGGLGIGLALVRRLVEMHEGTVAAHSDGPGKGATFVVTLPTQKLA